MQQPRVGLGVFILNHYNELLLGQRLNAHGEENWAIPGGHLEYGESFADCARREVFEETGLEMTELYYYATTNDIFYDQQLHYVSIFMLGRQPHDQKIINKEPLKTREWQSFELKLLPTNLFLPIKNLMNKVSLLTLPKVLNEFEQS